MFQQKIVDGFQVEKPENWLVERDPWGIRRADQAVVVKFGGQVIIHQDEEGKEHYIRVNSEDIRAIPYDTPIVGYDTKTVNTLRLWEAESVEGFDLQLFNDMQYQRAVEKENSAEDISRVLYPTTRGLRARRFACASSIFSSPPRFRTSSSISRKSTEMISPFFRKRSPSSSTTRTPWWPSPN